MRAIAIIHRSRLLAAVLCFASCAEQETISKDGSSMPAEFVVVNHEIPSLLFDMRYFSNENFLGTKVRGYESARCLLTRPACDALEKAQREMSAMGYTLKIFDCYRPQKAVDHFVAWVGDVNDRRTKERYYPNEDKSRLIEKGYIADRSGHSRGSTVDLTVVESSSAAELDMGTPYDFFDPLSNTDDPRITPRQKRNRMLLKSVMESHGFVNYDKEWWHYTLANEPFADTYFNFPVK